MAGRQAVDAAGARGEASSSASTSSSSSLSAADEDTLPDLFRGFDIDGVAGASSASATAEAARGVRGLCAAPRLREACEDAASDVAAWTRQGGAPRALLVVSVGSASLAALTGLLVVGFFVAAVTTNAIVCSFLVSLVAAGGFLAVLLAFLASIYVGALSVAVFVVATTTVAAVIFIMTATGWAAFFWIVWFAATKCSGLVTTKRSTSTTNSVM
ncbi:hypothetical protein EJB05_42924, partial [Eragrostis curvula]